MYLAFTSFAVRMLQGRDIMKTSAAALNSQAFLELCRRFGAGGAQIDFSQVPVENTPALGAIRKAYEQAGIEVEVSIPSRYVETPEAFAQAAAVAAALGAKRARVALLSGRRYESFETRAAWDAFASKWRDTLPRMLAMNTPSLSTPVSNCRGADPMASRTPNSRILALTENASTPATPTTAIISATAAKPPNTSALRRSGASTSARTSSNVAARSTG